jgi:nicotinate-nucleotide adenylyltransferase
MKVALFGGRFDPIHNGHVAVAHEVLKMNKADEVWFSVENQHQWRPIVSSSEDRKHMAELAIAGEPKFAIDMTPVELGGQTETIKVVRALRKKYPQYEFLFVVGSDQLPTFHKWSHWEDLLKEVAFLVVARKNSPIDNVPVNAIVIKDPTYEPLGDSATRIREFLKEGKSIHGLVPMKVEEYIKEHKLYV